MMILLMIRNDDSHGNDDDDDDDDDDIHFIQVSSSTSWGDFKSNQIKLEQVKSNERGKKIWG